MSAAFGQPPTNVVDGLEQLVTGSGEPVTVFAHGFAGDIAGTRPLGSGVTGRRVFFHFRGHGRSEAPPGPWTFGDLAADLRAVADRAGASRAVGVSMGSGALGRLLSETPDRFERIVCYLPALLDGVRPQAAVSRTARMLAASEAGDAAAIAAAIETELPADVRGTPPGDAYVRQRTAQVRAHPLAPQIGTLWREPAVPDVAALTGFTGRALVLGCLGDEVHPVAWAERWAGLLPRAELFVYDDPAVLWHNRRDLRERISTFLND
ncbi:alpha/beta fold hydrolase [Actinoplanes sp. NPDC051343]|uniref:alpha/beta fold hydrolase n=1 Tax=Actinoplanes sp. NPDC051343 TaxID=3363906 RepID=UPI00379B28C3